MLDNLDEDGLFRLAAANFQQAEAFLNDAEVQLLRLRVRLEKCAALVRQIPRDDVLWQQVDVIFNGGPADTAAEPRESEAAQP
jgi:hypothetical protein